MISRETSVHLIISMIFNQSIKSELVFAVPEKLFDRLKCKAYDLEGLETAGYEKLLNAISSKPCLHRFPGTMSKNLYQTAQMINKEYQSDPRNIWNGKAPNGVLKALMKLNGIGYHKAVQCMLYLKELGELNKVPKESIPYLKDKCPCFFMNIDRDLMDIHRPLVFSFKEKYE